MLPSASNRLHQYQVEAARLQSNAGQWKVYQSTGSCVVLAGPGSGKTKTITVKMAQLLEEEVRSPRGIACITYSNECARELRRRLSGLGVVADRRVFIGTVHSFCHTQIVRPFAHLAGLGLPVNFGVVAGPSWDRLFEDAMKAAGVHDNPYFYRQTFDQYRQGLFSPRPVGDDDAQKVQSHLVKALRARASVDFHDMVWFGLRLVEEQPWVRHALSARFPVLIVDEYQDLGRPLHRLVRALHDQAGIRSIVVGDADQSVYGFTGAVPSLLEELASDPDFERIELALNYRCGQKIIDGSVRALGLKRTYTAAQGHDGEVVFHEYPDGIGSQVDAVLDDLIPSALAGRKGRSLGDVAILYLDKYDAVVVTQRVQARGLKYVGGDKEARHPSTPLTQWLEDCAAWCAGGWTAGNPRLSDILSFWRYVTEADGSKAFVIRQRELVTFLCDHRDSSETLGEWLKAFGKAEIEGMLKANAKLSDEHEVWNRLLAMAADPSTLGGWTVAQFGGLRGSPDHLNLLTLHSSKGLEFDVVAIVGLEDGRLPRYNATERGLKEARRLFYVGVTRARYEVHLYYSGWYARRGQRYDSGPSRFLAELADD